MTSKLIASKGGSQFLGVMTERNSNYEQHYKKQHDDHKVQTVVELTGNVTIKTINKRKAKVLKVVTKLKGPNIGVINNTYGPIKTTAKYAKQ